MKKHLYKLARYQMLLITIKTFLFTILFMSGISWADGANTTSVPFSNAASPQASTSGLKTYSDSKGVFSFEYPSYLKAFLKNFSFVALSRADDPSNKPIVIMCYDWQTVLPKPDNSNDSVKIDSIMSTKDGSKIYNLSYSDPRYMQFHVGNVGCRHFISLEDSDYPSYFLGIFLMDEKEFSEEPAHPHLEIVRDR